ncbi:uncharacterized protein L969DRAFT_90015 [Mixia osmundae IAM 14324]|uniref:C2H2-type domain-containing protein n=1 Tax=Mixia osmundae (strain CBS 9802 / IAM 14324 / JCM 22182 / KY 12970) TaxID=764103 RepID=G7DUQ4_MIXOS|nr:uncharacterized protein L969DRAFT_90015 [Mixia osmundae IAM 14324]KEI37471.1 hypothetical protein L969DRAFT_90015 [Mixia osmundae IAM 14324]GAA94314.1 hypothetical protein E5Q_00963 [Mixia osmundae IAM 14324]
MASHHQQKAISRERSAIDNAGALATSPSVSLTLAASQLSLASGTAPVPLSTTGRQHSATASHSISPTTSFKQRRRPSASSISASYKSSPSTGSGFTLRATDPEFESGSMSRRRSSSRIPYSNSVFREAGGSQRLASYTAPKNRDLGQPVPARSRAAPSSTQTRVLSASMPVVSRLPRRPSATGQSTATEVLSTSAQGPQRMPSRSSAFADSDDEEQDEENEEEARAPRRCARGETRQVAAPRESSGSRSSGGRKTLQCEKCAKVYRHPQCLIKHRWQHTMYWKEASKLMLSKHQQVELLEAAAILVNPQSLPAEKDYWPAAVSPPMSGLLGSEQLNSEILRQNSLRMSAAIAGSLHENRAQWGSFSQGGMVIKGSASISQDLSDFEDEEEEEDTDELGDRDGSDPSLTASHREGSGGDEGMFDLDEQDEEDGTKLISWSKGAPIEAAASVPILGYQRRRSGSGTTSEESRGKESGYASTAATSQHDHIRQHSANAGKPIAIQPSGWHNSSTAYARHSHLYPSPSVWEVGTAQPQNLQSAMASSAPPMGFFEVGKPTFTAEFADSDVRDQARTRTETVAEVDEYGRPIQHVASQSDGSTISLSPETQQSEVTANFDIEMDLES